MSREILNFELDLDFVLIAIISHSKDYVLCFHINKCLQTDFRKVEDYALSFFTRNEALQFSQYFFKAEASETEFYIIANYCANGFLIPEMGNVNYFMLIKNHFDKEDLQEVMYKLKNLQNIKMIAQVNPKLIKSNENLLF